MRNTATRCVGRFTIFCDAVGATDESARKWRLFGCRRRRFEIRFAGFRIARNRGVAALCLVLCGGAVGAADLSDARRLAEEGKRDDAAAAYRAWIEENPADEETGEAALELAALLDDLAEIRMLLENTLTHATSAPVRHSLLTALAAVCVQLGDLAAAQRYYRDASFALPGEKDFDSLLESALLSFELGEYRNAEAQARVIVETGKDRRLIGAAEVLLSRVYFATDRDSAALRLLTDPDGEPRTDLGAAGLYWLFRLSLLMNDPRAAESAAELLRSVYPLSLEAAIADGDAARLPTASVVFEAVSEVRREKASTSGSSASTVASSVETSAISIQTGSFTVRENAEYAAADLRAEGFDAAIEERTIGGTLYYRVVVPGVKRSDIADEILRLKEKGFEGFPLYE